METETLSQSLRSAVLAELENRTYQDVADEIGIELTVLFKFAKGADARLSTADAIAAWLARNGKDAGKRRKT